MDSGMAAPSPDRLECRFRDYMTPYTSGYLYIYIYIHTHTHVWVFTHMHVYIYIYIYMHIYIYAYIYTYIYAHVYIDTHMHYMCVYIYIHIRIYFCRSRAEPSREFAEPLRLFFAHEYEKLELWGWAFPARGSRVTSAKAEIDT